VIVKVHLGCGKRDFGEDWFHVDGADYKHVKHHDIINLPFAHETVDLIYASHVLEYFDRVEAADVLKNWGAFLRPGGVLRLAVPDFAVIAQLYSEGRVTLDQVVGPLYGRMALHGSYIYHRTTYDVETLSLLLVQSGFRDVRRYDWRETEHARFDDHSQAYLPHMDKDSGVLISLNVECNR